MIDRVRFGEDAYFGLWTALVVVFFVGVGSGKGLKDSVFFAYGS